MSRRDLLAAITSLRPIRLQGTFERHTSLHHALYSVGLLPDYSRQAERYDETRSASPLVLRAPGEALQGAPGRRLADIGGGTGNYALALGREGWEPVVVDRSAAMLAWAAGAISATTKPCRRNQTHRDETKTPSLRYLENRCVSG